MPTSKSQSQRPFPTPEWQHAIRRQLRSLPTSICDNAQLASLHIAVHEENVPFARTTLSTLTKIEAFCTSNTYKASIHCLPPWLRTRPERAKPCSEYIASLLTCWAQELGQQFSENRTEFEREDRTLRFTGDSYSRGVKSSLTACDLVSNTSLSVVIRNRRRHEWQLSSVELYALLTLADEQRKANPSSNIYKVQVIVIHTHWVCRLSADIPSTYISSIIDGKEKIVGSIKVLRTPWFNFLEDTGRQNILQALFEFFPLSLICTMPKPPFHHPQKRTRTESSKAFLKRHKTRGCTSAEEGDSPNDDNFSRGGEQLE